MNLAVWRETACRLVYVKQLEVLFNFFHGDC